MQRGAGVLLLPRPTTIGAGAVAKTNSLRVLAVLTAMLAAALVAVMVSHAPAKAQTAQDTLKQPPFPPTDVDLFAPAVYPGGPAMEPAGTTANDEATLRGQLKALLEERFGIGSTKVNQGLATFDAASTKEIVPHPRLRAALVSLKGTVGEPAIAGALDQTYSAVRFGTPCCNAIAQVMPQTDGTLHIVFNESYQYEDFRLLANTMAHEVLHRDTINANKEELTADSIDILVYGQFLLEVPELATSGTELARFKNTDLMARINTRDANGKLRLFTSQGNIFPESDVFVPYYAAPFEPLVHLQYRFRVVSYSSGHEISNLRTFAFGKGA